MNWAKLKDGVEEKNRICATQTNLLLMETFSAKVGLFVSRKKQGEQEEKEKDFFHCFLTCFCHLYSPIIFKRSFVLRGATFTVAFL